VKRPSRSLDPSLQNAQMAGQPVKILKVVANGATKRMGGPTGLMPKQLARQNLLI